MRYVLTVILLVLLGCDAPTIPGRDPVDIFDFDLPTTPRTVLRWAVGRDIRVYVADAGSSERTATLEAAFESGASAWNAVALFSEFRLVRTTDAVSADVLLSFTDQVLPVDTDDCRPELTVAVTTFCIDDIGTESARLRVFPLRGTGEPGNIRMVVLVLSSAATDFAVAQRLVAHELGHVVGIGRHSGDSRDLMYRIDQQTARPTARDAATAQVLYHSRADIEIR